MTPDKLPPAPSDETRYTTAPASQPSPSSVSETLSAPALRLSRSASDGPGGTIPGDLPAEESIHVPVTLRFADYFRFSLLGQFRQLRWTLPFSTLAIFGIFFLAGKFLMGGIVHTAAAHWPYLLLAIASFYCLVGILSLPLCYFQARRAWRRADVLREPKVYVFSETDIEVLGKSIHEVVDWRTIQRAERTGPLVMLWSGPRFAFILPIRAFGDATAWERFRRLVVSRVSHCRLGPGGLFPFAPGPSPGTSKPQPSAPAETEEVVPETRPLPDPGEESIRVHFTPTLTDHFRLNLRVVLWGVFRLFVVMISVFLLVPLLTQVDPSSQYGDPDYLLACGITTVLAFPLLFVFTFLSVILRWARDKTQQEPRTFVFSDSGIEREGVTFAGIVSWNNFNKIERRGWLIVLMTKQKRQWVVPVRAFSPEDRVKFRRLAESKVSNCRLR
jgi:hypothetical protein